MGSLLAIELVGRRGERPSSTSTSSISSEKLLLPPSLHDRWTGSFSFFFLSPRPQKLLDIDTVPRSVYDAEIWATQSISTTTTSPATFPTRWPFWRLTEGWHRQQLLASPTSISTRTRATDAHSHLLNGWYALWKTRGGSCRINSLRRPRGKKLINIDTTISLKYLCCSWLSLLQHIQNGTEGDFQSIRSRNDLRHGVDSPTKEAWARKRKKPSIVCSPKTYCTSCAIGTHPSMPVRIFSVPFNNNKRKKKKKKVLSVPTTFQKSQMARRKKRKWSISQVNPRTLSLSSVSEERFHSTPIRLEKIIKILLLKKAKKRKKRSQGVWTTISCGMRTYTQLAGLTRPTHPSESHLGPMFSHYIQIEEINCIKKHFTLN